MNDDERQPAPRPAGDIVAGRYEVLRVLGRGGFAVTYAARDRERDVDVALKELSLRTLSRWKAVELFEREAQVLASLDHPRVPAFIDAIAPGAATGADDSDAADTNVSFILVEGLAPGRSLEARLADGWRPDEAEARDIAAQVLATLAALQDRSPPVLHRDLKPANLILDDAGEIMIVDFGAVKATLASHSNLSSVVGTYGYMAPEQFQGRATPASDLYALGATLVHLLSGLHPAELPHHRLKIAFAAHIKVSPAFSAWLDRCLEPSPEDRFPTAAAGLAALPPAPGSTLPALWTGSDAADVTPPPGDRIFVEAVPDGLRIQVRDRLEHPAAFGLFTAWLVAISVVAAPSLRRLTPLTLAIICALWAAPLALMAPGLTSLGGSGELCIGPETWSLTRRFLGIRRVAVSGRTSELRVVDADVSLPGRVTALSIGTGRRSWVVARGLDGAERAWLSGTIRGFLP